MRRSKINGSFVKNLWDSVVIRARLGAKRAKKLKYEAVEQSPTRRPIYISGKSEDRELPMRKRQALISEARDQIRNFSLAGFALRKHLQFVSYYRFSAETPDREFNRLLEARVERWKRRDQCDAAGRSNFDELITLAESHRAIDGDVGLLKRSDCRLQIVEADRIRNPEGVGESDPNWVNGVKTNAEGRAVRYAVWKRKPDGGFEFEREINADNFELLAYRNRRDQTRGVSLFAPAVKMISYLYDGLDYALAKLKLEQMMGLVTKLDDGGNLAGLEQTDGNAIGERAREVFGQDLMHIALRVGEEAAFMESNNPTQNFQSFCEQVLRMIFAALDLPYSFYDGSKTNFYGSKGEFEQYLDTVEKKQNATIAILDDMLFDWLLPNWLADPRDPLFGSLPNGQGIESLRGSVGWRGSGLPTWRLFEYVKETEAAISGGLIDPYRLADSFGESLNKNLERLRDMSALAKEYRVALPYGQAAKVNIGL